MNLATPTRTAVASRTAAATRSALVDALTGAGLSATSYAPDVPTDNAAWPQWSLTEWNGALCDPSRYTFDVYAVLPAGEAATTVEAADALVATVSAALYGLVIVQNAEPVLITFSDQTTMPGVRFRVISRA